MKNISFFLIIFIINVYSQRLVTVQSFNVEGLTTIKYSRPRVASFFKEWIARGDVSIIQGTIQSDILKDLENSDYTVIAKSDHVLFFKTILFDYKLTKPIVGAFSSLPMSYVLNDVTYIAFKGSSDVTKNLIEQSLLLNSTSFNTTSQVVLVGDFSSCVKPVDQAKWKFCLGTTNTLVNSANCASDRIVVSDGVVFANGNIWDYSGDFNFTKSEMSAISSHYPIETNIFVSAKRWPFWVELATIVGMFGLLLTIVGILLLISCSLAMKRLKPTLKSNPEYQQVLLQ